MGATNNQSRSFTRASVVEPSKFQPESSAPSCAKRRDRVDRAAASTAFVAGLTMPMTIHCPGACATNRLSSH